MRLYFLKDTKAGFAPKGIFKKGNVYDVAPNNVPTMLDNGRAVLEADKPKSVKITRKPKAVLNRTNITISNYLQKK